MGSDYMACWIMHLYIYGTHIRLFGPIDRYDDLHNRAHSGVLLPTYSACLNMTIVRPAQFTCIWTTLSVPGSAHVTSEQITFYLWHARVWRYQTAHTSSLEFFFEAATQLELGRIRVFEISVASTGMVLAVKSPDPCTSTCAMTQIRDLEQVELP
jgi:hypothetical protein